MYDYSLFNLTLVFAAGLIAGVINVMAGGGSILTLPALILLGMPPSVANGTNRVGVLVQTLAAAASYKSAGRDEVKQSLRYTIFTIPGAVAGAVFSIQIPDDIFNKILAVVIVLVVISLLLPTKYAKVDATPKKIDFKIGFSLFLTGLYGGFLQVGVGFILMLVFGKLLQISLVKVNIFKTMAVLVYTIPSLAIFVASSNIDWVSGLVLSVGTAIGAWTMAKLSLKKGDGLVKVFLAIAAVIMSMKLFEVF